MSPVDSLQSPELKNKLALLEADLIEIRCGAISIQAQGGIKHRKSMYNAGTNLRFPHFCSGHSMFIR